MHTYMHIHTCPQVAELVRRVEVTRRKLPQIPALEQQIVTLQSQLDEERALSGRQSAELEATLRSDPSPTPPASTPTATATVTGTLAVILKPKPEPQAPTPTPTPTATPTPTPTPTPKPNPNPNSSP